jgi:hypothetical protein
MEQMKGATGGEQGGRVQDLQKRAAWVHTDYRASYQKEAAEDGWNQMKLRFKEYERLD